MKMKDLENWDRQFVLGDEQMAALTDFICQL